jgi:hypothetical protein
MAIDAENLTLIIVALITGLISPLSLQIMQFVLKKVHEKNENKHSLNKNQLIENDELIESKLRTLMEKYNSERVWIAEFHNGGKTYSGKSFQRFSTTYEVVNLGVSSEAPNTQNIPTSIFSQFFNKLDKNGYYHNADFDLNKDEISTVMKTFFENRGVKDVLAFSIKDIKGNFVGFLCLDSIPESYKINEDDIERLMIASSNLAGYLGM